ncbi:MAG TPA: hypothetical protein VNJ10_06740 [Sphingomonas sp.]|nr:hypothetical protein [Sphingomonas sp.]
MSRIDNDAATRQAIDLLQRALILIDGMDDHAAAAQLDNVLHILLDKAGASAAA